MTADAPAVVIEATPTTSGCTGCGTQATVILHPYPGRRCPTCISLPAGPFRADLAADMVQLGRADAALTYLRGWLAREVRIRFTRAAAAFAPRLRCWCGRPFHDVDATDCAEHTPTFEGAPDAC